MRRHAIAAVLTCSILGPARSQVIAHPNQIRGTFTLTNTNPEILALLETQGFGGLSVDARSVDHAPTLDASTIGVRVDATHATYEITVEAATPGIAYAVTALPSYRGASSRARSAMSIPIEPEPAPDASLDFEDCLGIVTARLVDPVGEPVIGSTARVNGRQPPAGSNEISWLVPDGVTVTFYVSVTTGTDPQSDTVVLQYAAGSATARCDETVSADCVIDPNPCDDGSGLHFGRIIGEIDVLGAPLIADGSTSASWAAATHVRAEGGPFGNSRWDLLTTPDRVRGAYELENLLASETEIPPDHYWVSGRFEIDLGGGVVETLLLPSTSVLVPGETTVDLADTYVIDPSDVAAGILVAGPPESPSRGRAMLSDAEAWANITGRWVAPVGARRWSVGMSASATVADEAYDDATATMTASWRLLTGGLHREPSYQSASTFINFSNTSNPDLPNDYYNGDFVFGGTWDHLHLQPGDMHGLHVRACVGQVLIGVRSTAAPFYLPRIAASGTLEGVDFEGNLVSRSQTGSGEGLPAAASSAATTGSVKLCLPEGDYVLTPTARFVNPGGGTSLTELQPIRLHVGCRQVITGSPQIVAQMTEAPSCAGTTPVTIGGDVSADEEIASLTWSVDGGPETDACRPCGINPDYEILVPGTGNPQMEVLMKATDVLGRVATVTHYARFADEPSAADIDPRAIPLRGWKDGDMATFRWGLSNGIGYSLYRGSIASLAAGRYDHATTGACRLPTPEWTGVPPAGDFYFLATAACGFGDAPVGRDSFGREIPGAGPRCP